MSEQSPIPQQREMIKKPLALEEGWPAVDPERAAVNP